MFNKKVNLSARRSRHKKLKIGRTVCPRRKITLQFLALVLLVVLSPFFLLENGGFTEVASGGGILAIDSPMLELDSLTMSEDGFILKNSGITAEVDRSELSDVFEYIVEDGDTLSGIARNFGISQDTIVWANKISNPHNLRPGTKLTILPVSGLLHSVKDGETVESIAKKYGVKVEDLKKQNRIEDDKLIAKNELIIPGARQKISTGSGRIVASNSTGTYAAYVSPSYSKLKIDGAIITANGAKNKVGKWMQKPTEGQYTTYFRRGHYAVDIANRSMPAVSAAADGTIVKSQCGWNGGYGCVVVIEHGDGVQTLYAHLSKLYAKVGDPVKKGQAIGKMGATGRVYGVTGIHVHFEVIVGGRKKNPLAFYSE